MRTHFFNFHPRNEDIDETLINIFDSLSIYTKRAKREFSNGDAAPNKTLLRGLMLYYGGHEYQGFLTFGGLIAVLISLLAAIIVWINLCKIALGIKFSRNLCTAIKTLTVISAVYVLTATVVIARLTTANADIIKISYDVTVAAGGVLMLIFATLTAAVPMTSAKERKEAKNTPPSGFENSLGKFINN